MSAKENTTGSTAIIQSDPEVIGAAQVVQGRAVLGGWSQNFNADGATIAMIEAAIELEQLRLSKARDEGTTASIKKRLEDLNSLHRELQGQPTSVELFEFSDEARTKLVRRLENIIGRR
jgi:hypothetical protein